MPPRHSSLKVLLLRKELLVLESEVNRSRLGEEWRMVRAETSVLGGKVRQYGAYASVAATIAGGFSLFRKDRPKTDLPAKPSFLGSLFRGLRVATSVWLAMRGIKR